MEKCAPWPAFALRLHGSRRQPEVGQILDEVVRKYGPIAGFTKVSQLFAEKVGVCLGGGVRASVYAGLELLRSPPGGVDFHWDSMVSITLEQGARRVLYVVEGIGKVGRAVYLGNEVLPRGG